MCVWFSKKKSLISFFKKTCFLRKHDFSGKFEGGTGLQVVSFNLNIHCKIMKHSMGILTAFMHKEYVRVVAQ